MLIGQAQVTCPFLELKEVDSTHQFHSDKERGMEVPRVKLEEKGMDPGHAKTSDVLHHCMIITVLVEFFLKPILTKK